MLALDAVATWRATHVSCAHWQQRTTHAKHTQHTQVAIPATIALVAFFSGAPAAGVPFALMAAILGFTLWLYRGQLALVARLLAVSVHALADQPGVIVAALALQLLGEWSRVVKIGG